MSISRRHHEKRATRRAGLVLVGLVALSILAPSAPVAAASGVTVSYSIRLEGLATPVVPADAPTTATAAEVTAALGALLVAMDRHIAGSGDAGRTVHRQLASDAVAWLDGAASTTTGAAAPVWTTHQRDRVGAHLSL